MRNRVRYCALVRTKLMRPIAALAMVCGLTANALADDGGRWMFRFETRFGGDRNEHLLQFATGPGTLLVPHDAYPLGAPFAWTLYSSDPKRWAVLNVSGAGERRDRVFRELSCSQFEHGDPAFALGRIFGIGAGHSLPNVPREGQKGLLEECDGGTLFLDDFDCLPRNVQDLLLYPLEGRPFEPGVGRGSPVTISVRFILATNQDPDELVRRGALRADLLSRLGARVDIPPLRQRREDIAVLASHFLAECSEELGHRVSTISPRAMNLLKTRDFSRDNVRELRAAIRTAVGRAMLEGDTTLRAGYFPDAPGTDTGAGDATVISSTPPAARSTLSGEMSRELAVLRKYRFRIAPAEIELGFSSKSRTLSNHLRGICIRALAENGWDIAAAARAVAGDDDAEVLARLAGKIRRYLLNIAAGVRSGDSRRLYNNLPAAYRPYLDAAVARRREAH